jgi:hypothetical protein
VENLEAHVSLDAAVLDLLRLNVGADVSLGKVNLEITGVEAQAILEVRLDNVADIVDRVLTTIDRNPEILQNIGRGLESAVRDVGGAVEDVGEGAGGTVGEVGRGTGGAVRNAAGAAGETVRSVGESAPAAEGLAREAGGGTPRREREARRRPRAGHPAETEPAPRVGPDEGAETTALHGALRETEESVRELGRALLQAASKRTRSPARGPRRGEDRP